MATTPRTILITGAAGHLGRATAARARAQGARLLLLDRDAGALQRAYGGAADEAQVQVAADLLDRAQLAAALAPQIERLGRVDTLLHIAGGFRMGEAVHETTAHSWDFLMDLNARSFVNVAAVLVPHLLAHGGGRIVTVGAGAALRGGAQMGAYAASKSALIRLTEAMSAELKGQGVNVNCVLPSTIDTPDNRAAMPDADATQWVHPDALADVMLFLASDAARAVHGAALPVSGLV
ncbi:SDR family NAD(P)-dependent oxidoreductase [Pseudorhodoferax sp. Leaf274]|uniref:SDR family NAD(P)-dependent oxidoreductase n=1 Tax=Pseudorhodoferax sp. Leaf274 TaxID=1736318 RepID=UPI0007028385|nr:SDR family NAD(P)-dependent oxidoreductase [Pseudorhodoferax sp. Leaf274]KQP49207.1 3-oxoacyl-ACP reductase [Pseudorhodoferax sp. Leaf274]